MIRLGGIKFSEELVQITVSRTSVHDSEIQYLLNLMTGKKINLPFLCHTGAASEADSTTVFCVERSEYDTVQQLLSLSTLHISQWFSIPSVGTVTIFPHRNSFRVLGTSLAVFGKNGYPVYSVGTSISALAVNTDFSMLDEIASSLQQYFELPENHAPFRPEFQLKEMDE